MVVVVVGSLLVDARGMVVAVAVPTNKNVVACLFKKYGFIFLLVWGRQHTHFSPKKTKPYDACNFSRTREKKGAPRLAAVVAARNPQHNQPTAR